MFCYLACVAFCKLLGVLVLHPWEAGLSVGGRCGTNELVLVRLDAVIA